jgi:acetyltransferase-like isoleucine patch superfamily enzyme
VGKACFMGVNSTVSNNTNIGNNCIIGAGALILSDVEDNQTAVGIWKKKKQS